MRNPARIPYIIHRIFCIWMKNPQLRLGQLIGNVVNSDYLYEIGDDELLKSLEKYD